MAVLSDPDRATLTATYQADASVIRDPLPLSKADLRAAINAIDSWVDSNAASYNSAIPQPARGVLTSRQKAQLLLSVVRRRWEVS